MNKSKDSQTKKSSQYEPPETASPETSPPQGEPPETSPPSNSDFVGTWICQYYDWTKNQILPPPSFPLTITQETAETLDGTYPLPGPDAKMWGYLSHEGRLWAGSYKGIQEGTFVFIMDNSKQSFHGAWVDDEADGPPQPWWGTRQE